MYTDIPANSPSSGSEGRGMGLLVLFVCVRAVLCVRLCAHTQTSLVHPRPCVCPAGKPAQPPHWLDWGRGTAAASSAALGSLA